MRMRRGRRRTCCNPRGAYRHPGKPRRSVIILDEIDKASRDFPNDLLREIEDLAFRVPELSRRARRPRPTPRRQAASQANLRPIVVVTSNEERQLPDAFLQALRLPRDRLPRRRHADADRARAGLRKRLPSKNLDDLNDPEGYDLPVEDGAVLARACLPRFRDMRLDKRPGIIRDDQTRRRLLAYPRSQPPSPLAQRLPQLRRRSASCGDRNPLAGLIDGRITRLAACGLSP